MTAAQRAARKLDRIIATANGGNYPRTRREYVRTARALDCSVSLSPGIGPDAACVLDGTIYAPEIGPAGLESVHRHELREAAAQWAGCAPYVAPVTPHEAACIDLSEPPRRLTRTLALQISRTAARMATLLDAAGLGSALVSVRPDRPSGYTVRVDYSP